MYRYMVQRRPTPPPVVVGPWCGALLVSDAADFLWFLVVVVVVVVIVVE